MVTIGLVRELTAEAARRAALGAGAKLVGTFAQRLTQGDIGAIVTLAPDILLLAGGTDGGNSDVILHNAAALGQSILSCPIVLAGNRSATDAALALLAGKDVIVTENVMPEFNVLNIEPARVAIRQVFIDRIVHAKGIDRAQAEFDRRCCLNGRGFQPRCKYNKINRSFELSASFSFATTEYGQYVPMAFLKASLNR